MSGPAGGSGPAAGGLPRGTTDAGVGWAIASLTSVAIGVLGLVGAIASAVAMPTHTDGGHGGDGAVGLVVVAAGMAWIAAWALAGIGLATVALNRSAGRTPDGTAQRPKVVTLALAVALAPFAVGILLTIGAGFLDALAG